MKILWHSNAPWAPTGYGQQTALFTPKINEHHDVSISAFYGLEGDRIKWEGIDVYPGLHPDFGNAFLNHHAQRCFGGLKDGLVVTLMDVWVLDRQMCSTMNIASWVPVDHKPVPFNVANYFQATGAVPIAMSRYGQQELKNANLEPLYVPHGVDTNIFKPHNKAEVRKEFGASEDAFIIGMVAANKGYPSRKGFQQAFQAFDLFREKHSNALLYLHTITNADWAQGEDLLSIAKSLGIQDHVIIPPTYRMAYDPIPPDGMARIYSTFDVLLNPAMGEGFGIPILEAAACGVPSIVTDITAMPEVAGSAGWKVNWIPVWTKGGAWWGQARVEEIVQALEECYSQTESERDLRSLDARNHALSYDVETVMDDYWLPALEEIEERLFDRKPSIQKTDLTAA